MLEGGKNRRLSKPVNLRHLLRMVCRQWVMVSGTRSVPLVTYDFALSPKQVFQELDGMGHPLSGVWAKS